MKRRSYTDKMVEFLSTNADLCTLAELTKKFNINFKCNKTLSAITNFVSENKLRKPSLTFTDEMVDFLRSSPEYITKSELTKSFNSKFNLQVGTGAIRHQCLKFGIQKAKKISGNMIEFLRANFEGPSGFSVDKG